MADSWRTRLEALPDHPPIDPGGTVLVISAHPDDEVLSVGAWLSEQRRRDLVFVTVTDGEASHPGSPSITSEELRTRRPRELAAALGELGITDAPIHRLGLPDGDLATQRSELRRDLAPFVEAADLVLAPFEQDGHPDHDAVGLTALELCGNHTTLWRFPIWTWSWTSPGRQHWLSSARRLGTTSAGRQRKRLAIARFTTQVRPLSDHPADLAVVDEALLSHALLAPEVVLT